MMRFLAVLLLLLASPAQAQFNGCRGGICQSVGGASAAYVGPLDVQPGATVAYCMRACSSASRGSNVVDIQRASDSTTATFVSLPSGKVDIASINTFLTSTTGKITKWYDQSGNGKHAVASGAFLDFTINPSGLGVGNMAVTFTGDNRFLVTPSLSAAQPFFISGVAVRRSGTNFSAILGANATSPGLVFNNTANSMVVFGGSVGSFTAADGVFNATAGLFNGASSQGYVNGVGSGALSAGTAGVSSAMVIGYFSSTALMGDIAEVILYPSDVSSNAGSISANQRSSTNGYNF